MDWNDGISKQIAELFEGTQEIEMKTLETFKATIDDAASKYFNKVSSSGDIISTNLQGKLKIEQIKDRGSKYYGYRIIYDGETKNGIPLEKLANILNYGRQKSTDRTGRYIGTTTGTMFISNAVKELKGLSSRIEKNVVKTLTTSHKKKKSKIYKDSFDEFEDALMQKGIDHDRLFKIKIQ